jgi:hypothetical protein
MVLETSPFTFSAEASELGWPPGRLPRRLETDMGNGQPFVLDAMSDEMATYRQQLGCIELRVFND